MRNSDYISFNKDAAELQPNGFLNVLANLTRTGVFVYSKISPDGTIETIRQLRLPEEVFSEEALASLIGIPVTNDHPRKLISPENASDYIVGMSSDRPKKVFAPVQNGDTEEYVQQLVTFFDQDTIDQVSSGEKTQMSLGYTTELEDSAGVWKGQKYDVIQRNIRYNHLSLVDKARGGHNCKVLLDDKEVVVQLDGESIEDDHQSDDNNNKGEDMKIFKYGGKEFNVDEDVHALLTSMNEDLDESAEDLAEAKKKVDKLTARCDDLKDQIQAQKDSADSIPELVKARVKLEREASEILDDDVCLDGLSDIEIQKKVIAKCRPKVDLADKSDDYISARYEVCVEDSSDSSKGNKNENDLGDSHTNNDGGDDNSVAAARKRSWEKAKELYKESFKK